MQTVLYVDRQGASFPIGSLPRIVRLSSGTKGGRRQADSSTSRPDFIGVGGIYATTAVKYIKLGASATKSACFASKQLRIFV